MPHRILNDDWENYDNRKIRDNRDRSKFSCEEPWEVDYLIRIIKKHFPHLSEQKIKDAIAACCQTVRAPRPRKEFVERVVKRLG